jgi:hypothetical protein
MIVARMEHVNARVSLASFQGSARTWVKAVDHEPCRAAFAKIIDVYVLTPAPKKDAGTMPKPRLVSGGCPAEDMKNIHHR